MFTSKHTQIKRIWRGNEAEVMRRCGGGSEETEVVNGDQLRKRDVGMVHHEPLQEKVRTKKSVCMLVICMHNKKRE